jgi:hypothetical protein
MAGITLATPADVDRAAAELAAVDGGDLERAALSVLAGDMALLAGAVAVRDLARVEELVRHGLAVREVLYAHAARGEAELDEPLVERLTATRAETAGTCGMGGR